MRSRALSGTFAVAAALALTSVGAYAQWSDLGLSGRNVTQLRWGHGLLYACTSTGLHRKVAETADSAWVLLGFSGQVVHDVLPITPETLIVARAITAVGADTVALFRSTDAGATWSPFQNGLGSGGFGSERMVTVLFSPPDPPGSIFAGTRNGISKSTDGGLSWRRVSLGGSYNFLTSGVSTLWGGGVSYGFTPFVRRSTNGGESWMTSFTSPFDAEAHAMAFDPSDANVAFLGASSDLYRTADNGASWSLVPLAPGVASTALGNRAFPPLRLYANGTGPPGSATFFRSDDGGMSWDPVSFTGARSSFLRPILVRSGPASDTLFFGSASGVLRYVEVALVGVDMSAGESPLQLRAFPNPFRAQTALMFRLPRASRTSVTILDSAGRLIATLLEGNLEIGFHHVVWTPGVLPSGAYFCRLRVDSKATSLKLVFVE